MISKKKSKHNQYLFSLLHNKILNFLQFQHYNWYQSTHANSKISNSKPPYTNNEQCKY